MAEIRTRMTPCSYVTNAVLGRLQSVAIPGIKREEIDILPEGRVPASMGERFITISPEADITTGLNADYRGSYITFRVYLIHRMRATPNDRQGNMYHLHNEMHDTQQTIKDAIQSLDMFTILSELITNTESSNPLQERFSIARAFIHRMTTLNPSHLYPGFFLSKHSEADSKVAGFRTYQSFQSPVFYPIINPLLCEN